MAVRRSTAVPDVNTYLDDEDGEEDLRVVAPSRPAAVKEPEARADRTVVLEDEDEDEVPVRSSSIQAGWAEAKKAIANSGGKGFTDEFRFSVEAQLVKFVSPEPIAVFRQHWLTEKSGKKSYVCLGDKCPLCRVAGHKPDQKIAFSILNFSGEDGPEAQVLITGTRFAGQLEKLHLDRKVGPLDQQFWALSRTGQKSQTAYSALPVKSRDIMDDWELDPEIVNRALAESKPLDASVIREEPYKELMDIARDLVD